MTGEGKKWHRNTAGKQRGPAGKSSLTRFKWVSSDQSLSFTVVCFPSCAKRHNGYRAKTFESIQRAILPENCYFTSWADGGDWASAGNQTHTIAALLPHDTHCDAQSRRKKNAIRWREVSLFIYITYYMYDGEDIHWPCTADTNVVVAGDLR